jgi:hypothetical protein
MAKNTSSNPSTPQISLKNAIVLIQSLHKDVSELPQKNDAKVDALRRRSKMIIGQIFGGNCQYLEDLDGIQFFPTVGFSGMTDDIYNDAWTSGVSEITNLLNTIQEDLELRQAPAEPMSIEAENRKAMPKKPYNTLSIFISHSAKDEQLAASLVTLLRSALNIPADKIRCTSVNGYRLPIGAHTEVQLRKEVQDTKAFIVLITPSSIASAYVMFELGARWGAELYLAPLLGAGASASAEFLRGPLSSLNALNCEDPSQVHQLISDLSEQLEIQNPTKPEVYQNLIADLIESSKALNQSAASKVSTQPPEAPQNISKEEIEVLKLFAISSGKGLVKEAIIGRFNLHPLKIGQILEHLTKGDYLDFSGNIGGGNSYYRLTSKGRDYLIENNMV